MDRRLLDLRRRLDADPADPTLRAHYQALLARRPRDLTRGALLDLARWASADRTGRDAATAAAITELEGFEWTGETADPPQLAKLRHRLSGLDYILLPGIVETRTLASGEPVTLQVTPPYAFAARVLQVGDIAPEDPAPERLLDSETRPLYAPQLALRERLGGRLARASEWRQALRPQGEFAVRGAGAWVRPGRSGAAPLPGISIDAQPLYEALDTPGYDRFEQHEEELGAPPKHVYRLARRLLTQCDADAELVVEVRRIGEYGGELHPLTTLPCQVGQAVTSDIIIQGDAAIDRKHFIIERRGERLVLRNQSPAGTWMNHKPVQDVVPLRAFADIRAGRSTLRLLPRVLSPGAAP